MFKKIMALLFAVCALVALSYAEDVDPNIVVSATDQLTYLVTRHESFSSQMSSDAMWDTTATINAGYSERFRITSFIDTDNYLLRAVVISVTDDSKVMFFGDGVNCKYATVDSTSGGYIRASKSLTVYNTASASIDSFYVQADNASTDVDIWIFAARTKVLAP
jgi:hypothetical protein